MEIIKIKKPLRTIKQHGFVNFFSNFIDKHARLARPLTELLKKGAVFDMSTPARQQAFQALKDALISAPVLTICEPAGSNPRPSASKGTAQPDYANA
jgi:hypothetical protein